MSEIIRQTLDDLSTNPSLVDFPTKAVACYRWFHLIEPPYGWAVNNTQWRLTPLGFDKVRKDREP